MSRAQRLLDLLQALRRHRRPVTGRALAGELGVSLRTLYRDIATLQAQGADIAGEAGVGYVLRPGFLLPPLMFLAEEIEALALGSRWVAEQGDARLAAAARDALAKIGAVLPAELRDGMQASGLLIGPAAPATDCVDLGVIRHAIRTERKLGLRYADANGQTSERTVWPLALGFMERSRILVAWCELRQDFRHFRTDRIAALSETAARLPRRRQVLLAQWRATQGIEG